MGTENDFPGRTPPFTVREQLLANALGEVAGLLDQIDDLRLKIEASASGSSACISKAAEQVSETIKEAAQIDALTAMKAAGAAQKAAQDVLDSRDMLAKSLQLMLSDIRRTQVKGEMLHLKSVVAVTICAGSLGAMLAYLLASGRISTIGDLMNEQALAIGLVAILAGVIGYLAGRRA